MNVRILDEAQLDLDAGFQFYESQETDLGDYFIDSLSSDIDSLRLYAGIHALHLGFHRLIPKRFPYAVYYLVETGAVSIYAVLDCRQDPRSIRKRLTGQSG